MKKETEAGRQRKKESKDKMSSPDSTFLAIFAPEAKLSHVLPVALLSNLLSFCELKNSLFYFRLRVFKSLRSKITIIVIFEQIMGLNFGYSKTC